MKYTKKAITVLVSTIVIAGITISVAGCSSNKAFAIPPSSSISNISSNVSNNIIDQSSEEVSSNIVSSNIQSSNVVSSQVVSSKIKLPQSSTPKVTPEKTVKNTAVKTNTETVSEVNKTVMVSETTTVPKVTCAENEIDFRYIEENNAVLSFIDKNDTSSIYTTNGKFETKFKLICESYLSTIDETNKFIIIDYSGNFHSKYQTADGLKEIGFTLKNAAGTNIDFENYKLCMIKIPYTNLSDVSDMNLSCQGQSIKITVA